VKLSRKILTVASFVIGALVILSILRAGDNGGVQPPLPTRESKIPKDVTKVTPATDVNPPKSESDLYYDPVPVKGLVNTAGGEDSPFILPDGKTLYFFFTPDVRVPAEKQVIDQVTGIYVSRNVGNTWQEAERVVLQDPGKPALDGGAFVQGKTMYFCSAREGYAGLHWFKAEYADGKWGNWVNADLELKTQEYSVGELHITSNGSELYFHSDRPGGKGGLDIWVSRRIDGVWTEPTNLVVVNSGGSEGWPCVTEDGGELWFSRDYGIWRSLRVEGEWQEPVRMFFPLTGEPSVDEEGNVYFVHHFYKDNVMLEADIYVAAKKPRIYGVSLSPRSSQPGDFKEFLGRAEQAGDVLRWAGDWLELNTEGGAPEVIKELADSRGMIPLIEVSPQSNGDLIRPLNDTNREKYLKSVADFAETHHPPYLAIGVEVNSLYIKSEASFESFVALYNEAYDEVKEVSPDTKVFTVFQYELLKGYTLWSAGPADESKSQWWMLELFKTDAVAFTTYPCLVYKDPSIIPDDYYGEIREHTLKPIIFSEIGWHSEGSPAGWESSEAEQAAFIVNYNELTKNLSVEISVWSFVYDPNTIEPFRSMGLFRDDDTSRPAWDSWIKISR
jgi:hypothetical protein